MALGVFLVQKLAQFGQDTLLAGPALQVSQELRQPLFARLQRLEFGALEKLSAGDLTYRLTEDADRVGEVIYKTIQDSTPSFLQLVVVLGYMIWLDAPLALATLLLAPLVVVLVSVFGARVMGAAERSQKQVSELAGLLGEAIGGLPLVRAFAAEPGCRIASSRRSTCTARPATAPCACWPCNTPWWASSKRRGFSRCC
jgi:ATP-binding cassette subfamily B protein